MYGRTVLLVGSVLVFLAGGCGDPDPGGRTVDGEDPPARETARNLLAKARELHDERQYDRALELVRRAERADSSLAEVYFARGEIYRRIGRIGAARRAYREALEREGSGSQPVRLRLGDLAREQDRYAEALDWYRREWEILAGRLEERDVSPGEISVRTRDGRLIQAVQIRRARAHALTGELEEADRLLEKAIRRDSTDALAHYYAGKIHQERGDRREALAHARRAVGSSPFQPTYRYLLGSLLVQEERAEEAVAHLENVVEARPRHVGAHYNLGQAYMLTGREERGRTFLARSDSLRTHQQRINQARARALRRRDDPERWMAYARALREGGRIDEARKAYRAVLTVDSTRIEARRQLERIEGP